MANQFFTWRVRKSGRGGSRAIAAAIGLWIGFSAWQLEGADDPMTAMTTAPAAGGPAWAEPGQIGPNQVPPPPPPMSQPVSPNPAATAAAPPVAPQVDVNGAGPGIGRPEIVPVAEVRATYDDNIFIRHTNRQSDEYTTVVAGLAVGWGEFRDRVAPLGQYQEAYEQLHTPDFDARQFLFASYTPGYTAFIRHSDQDTVDQNAAIGARWTFGGLTTDLQANYRLFSEGLVDAGTRVRQTEFNITLDNQYVITERTGVEADINVVTHHFSNGSLVDSNEFIDRDYLNYQLLPKTLISAGVGLGYVSVAQGPNQAYEQGLLRVVYDSGRKLSGSLFGGVEFREFSGGGGTDTNPVFGLQAVYSPADGTSISLQASRLVTNSAEYVAQNIVTTGGSLAVSQLLFQKVTLTLRGSYQHDDYGGIAGTGSVARTDNEIGAEASLAFHLTAYAAISLAYNYWHNLSTLSTYSFNDNRATLDINMMF